MNEFQIAKLCYESTQVFSEIAECKTRVNWENLNDEDKNIIVDIIRKLLTLESLSPDIVHDTWMEISKKYGWQLGIVKSRPFKTSPCFVPYSDLPEIEKQKDMIVLGSINSVRD